MPLYGELPEIQTSAGDAIHGFPVQILRPAKTAVLRLPTNQEMIDYLNQQKTLYRDLGRRKGQSESVPNPKSDLDLFNRIRIDKGPEFDEAEAARAIGLLTRQRVTKCEREGEAYRIKLLTVFGETEHVINIPFEKELAVYRRNVFKAIDLPHGVEERRYPWSWSSSALLATSIPSFRTQTISAGRVACSRPAPAADPPLRARRGSVRRRGGRAAWVSGCERRNLHRLRPCVRGRRH